MKYRGEVVIAEEREKQRRGRISSFSQWIGPATWSASISWIREGRLFQTRLRVCNFYYIHIFLIVSF
ncbi:hypothetical protein SUGI_1013270 [Cryptomeria japonica]|nr:hypothetical protein SUGI_1013270 [Cryptomeria japonica]